MNFSQKIPSILESIPKLISLFIEEIQDLNFSQDDLFGIRLCFEEALVNAVKHGNQLNPDLFVQVTAKTEGASLIVTIEDQGQGFDHENIDDPTREHNLRKPSGRGIFLIKKNMDRVEFFNQGRGIQMTKFLKKEA